MKKNLKKKKSVLHPSFSPHCALFLFKALLTVWYIYLLIVLLYQLQCKLQNKDGLFCVLLETQHLEHYLIHCCCCCVASVVSDSVRPHRRQPARLPRPWDSPGKNTGVGSCFLLQCMKVKRESEVAQSCLTLSDPMDCSPLGSSVRGLFQAGVLEWGSHCLLRPGTLRWPVNIC